jgi:hypothetical protein
MPMPAMIPRSSGIQRVKRPVIEQDQGTGR